MICCDPVCTMSNVSARRTTVRRSNIVDPGLQEDPLGHEEGQRRARSRPGPEL